MKACGGVDVYTHIFLSSALAGGVWSASRPGRFTTGERAPTDHSTPTSAEVKKMWIYRSTPPHAFMA
jgi:hypothetical protein